MSTRLRRAGTAGPVRAMRRRAAGALLALVVVAGIVAGCGEQSQVRWDTYIPTLQQRIDSASTEKSCVKLAGLLAFAHATGEAHEKATGVPNDALVSYIKAAQESAGCPTS